MMRTASAAVLLFLLTSGDALTLQSRGSKEQESAFVKLPAASATNASATNAGAALAADMGAYPGTSSGVSGVVSVTVTGGLLDLSYTLTGLSPSETSGGLHIHSGSGIDVCSDASLVGGHYFATGFTDPWTTTWTKASGATSASGTFLVGASGYDTLAENYLHAVVVHAANGTRIGCGYLAWTTAVGAVGDPHMSNVRGQRFDLLQPGTHTLLQIPRGADPWGTLLRVDANAQHLGSACADMFIQALNVTGKWADAKPRANGKARAGGFQYFAKPTNGLEGTNWRHFGKVDLKVIWGHTSEGVNYLNFFARHLGQTGYTVGGLLGEDDHIAAATPSAQCTLGVDLHAKTPEEEEVTPSGSIAEASLE